jgi:Protein of unknown function (DUF3467)
MSDHNNQTADAPTPRQRDPQFRDLYTNQIAVSFSPFDVSLTFSKITEIFPTVQGVIDLCNVTISPQQFKSLVRVLSETLEAYEENFGKLTISDDDIEPQLNKDDLSNLIAEGRKKNIAARQKAKSSIRK